MVERYIEKSIEINAPVQMVWQVLTDNTFIPQYMFQCEALTDWQPGSPLLWRGVADGKLYVKGQVVTFDVPHVLEYTVIDPNNLAIEDVPANYLVLTFLVKKRDADSSILEVKQGDFSTVANGEQRYKDTAGGDDSILKEIKRVAEEHARSGHTF